MLIMSLGNRLGRSNRLRLFRALGFFSRPSRALPLVLVVVATALLARAAFRVHKHHSGNGKNSGGRNKQDVGPASSTIAAAQTLALLEMDGAEATMRGGSNEKRQPQKQSVGGKTAGTGSGSSSNGGGGSSSGASLILPRPLELMKAGVSLVDEYKIPDVVVDEKNTECSCLNPQSGPNCCQRTWRAEHKMGVIIAQQVLKKMKRKNLISIQYHCWQQPEGHMKFVSPTVDYRDAMVFRNIYSALVSGYQYHAAGHECYLTARGKPLKRRPFYMLEAGDWQRFVNSPLDPPPNPKHSLCEYMRDVSELTGMRTYIEWVFNVKYSSFLSRWAISREFSHVRDRTVEVCFEDLSSTDKDLESIHKVVDFLHNGDPTANSWMGSREELHDTKGHSTSKDPAKRERLLNIIKQLDEEIYNGDIAWLDSMLPC